MTEFVVCVYASVLVCTVVNFRPTAETSLSLHAHGSCPQSFTGPVDHEQTMMARM